MASESNVLIVGSGGREHALAWKLAQSTQVGQVWVAPGNDGMHSPPSNATAAITPISIAEGDFAALIDFALEHAVALTVIGPEVPLAAGAVDAFAKAGLHAFGPTQAAARLEASKAFAKDFMTRHQIPTARYACFTEIEPALAYLQQVDYEVVIKASGLAAGKGVIVPDTREAAESALRQIMTDRAFGSAGDEVLIEERLFGQEASILVFSDGEFIATMPASQDHKPIFDGDQGPNTGGMGAYAPAPIITPDHMETLRETVLQPVIEGLRREGTPFVGVLYAGVMMTEAGPRVLEFNCRFGDPETQVILPLLESDLFEIFVACIDGSLAKQPVRWRKGAAATVVAASEGYPGAYLKGRPISGIEAANALSNTVVFQAGTRLAENNRLVTNGGRVLAVTGVGGELTEALDRAYSGLQHIHFDGIYFRRDIGAKAIQR